MDKHITNNSIFNLQQGVDSVASNVAIPRVNALLCVKKEKKALSNFDLTDREQFLQAVHYTNLQPLWWRDNLIKSNKI